MAKEFNQSEYDNNLAQIAAALVRVGQKSDIFADEEIIARQLEQCFCSLVFYESALLRTLMTQAFVVGSPYHEVTEVRPQILECDVVRFQNNKEHEVRRA